MAKKEKKPKKAAKPASGDVVSLRRWDAAKTDRLNAAHWKHADGNSINNDLLLDRESLVRRATFEIQNNPILEGVVLTHQSSIVGAEGPILQVECNSERYSSALETVFYDWWQQPETTGQMNGVELLQQCVGLTWSNGEFLMQEVDDPDADGISYRLNVVHPRRLRDPLAAFNSRIMMGVERNKIGKPTRYFIVDSDQDEYGLYGSSLEPVAYGADRIIHGFHTTEPGQVRGFPICASALQDAADLRDCDNQILDAIRLQADYAILLFSNHPDAQYVAVNESTDIQRRSISTAPPGWEPRGLNTTQPGPNVAEYRRERIRNLGRPVNMPLMMVLLDSGDHNYSSARFDGQIYNRGIMCRQAWFNRILMNRVIRRVERQAELRRMLPKRPSRVDFHWTWPVAPHVDPEKEAKAWAALLAINGCSEFDVAAAMGKDFEAVVAARKRASEILAKAGLSPAQVASVIRPMPDGQDDGEKPPASKSKKTQVA